MTSHALQYIQRLELHPLSIRQQPRHLAGVHWHACRTIAANDVAAIAADVAANSDAVPHAFVFTQHFASFPPSSAVRFVCASLDSRQGQLFSYLSFPLPLCVPVDAVGSDTFICGAGPLLGVRSYLGRVQADRGGHCASEGAPRGCASPFRVPEHKRLQVHGRSRGHRAWGAAVRAPQSQPPPCRVPQHGVVQGGARPASRELVREPGLREVYPTTNIVARND